ncbi:MAG: hypothetical protein KGH77_03260 [Candidatus Micrarchaeota archaeon]|nr:hypothetical protein [Candidatus Micrarchaeota archaeon]MDE1864419.1 hypothetical protein [Candidatus Micrarchaeota archaeon]
MLRTEPMQKVRMLFLENERDTVVEFLHGQGILDFRRSKLELGDVQSSSLPSISDALIRVNGALGILKAQVVKQIHHVKTEELVKKVRNSSYIDQIFKLGDRQREISEDESGLAYAQRVSGYFSATGIDFSKLNSDVLAFKAVLAENKDAQKVVEAIKAAKLNSSCVTNLADKKKTLVFIAYDKAKSIEDALRPFQLDEIDIKSKYLKGTVEQILENVRKTRESHIFEGKKIEHELLELGAKHYSELASYKEMLEIESQRAGAASNFKKTEKVFVVEGWLPEKKYEQFVGELFKFTKNRCYVEKVDDKELAPTLVNRPGFLRPFDYLMEFYSVPRSDEIDPTWIFIISFPIFYGLMVSDAGYGILSLLFSTWITRKTNPEGIMYNSAKVWQLSSISAIFFGFLSNQYLGFRLNQYFTTFTGFDWVKDATTILLLTIVFGLVQVILGFIFSFYNNWGKGHKKAAISKLTSILTILVGIVAVYGFFTGASYMIPFGILMLILLIITGALSGIEASEITNLMTHPLSYARILGFGLASVIIAMLIDNAFTPSFHYGILGFIGFTIIFILLHFVNMILGIFEGLIQGVRLNFVEFFSKFYSGGGIKFRPFSYKRINTKENE